MRVAVEGIVARPASGHHFLHVRCLTYSRHPRKGEHKCSTRNRWW